jgi:ubiquinone biosynthesis protein
VLSAAAHLWRVGRAGFVLAREGVFALVDPEALPPGPRLAVKIARVIERRGAGAGPARLATALTRLGPPYVKLGQFLATRPDVVGNTIAADLEALQDKMPPFPQAEAEACVAEALGRPVATLFASFGPPVAAASIAQVHRAMTVGGQDLAIKVLRPGIERQFQRDLDSFFYVARSAERQSAEARRLRLVATVETLARSVAIELDLRLEAAALSELAENMKDDSDFRVPKVDWERTARRVLATEWVDGIPLNERAKLSAAGHDLVRLARILIQSFLRQAIGDGFFTPTCIRETCSSTHTAGSSPSISGSWDGSDRRSGASSPRSCSDSSPRTGIAPLKCTSRRATSRRIIRSRTSRRRYAQSASRFTTGRRAKSRWRSCSRCSLR